MDLECELSQTKERISRVSSLARLSELCWRQDPTRPSPPLGQLWGASIQDDEWTQLPRTKLHREIKFQLPNETLDSQHVSVWVGCFFFFFGFLWICGLLFFVELFDLWVCDFFPFLHCKIFLSHLYLWWGLILYKYVCACVNRGGCLWSGDYGGVMPENKRRRALHGQSGKRESC